MLNNTAHGLLFREKLTPVNGKYKFQVTEFYRDNTVSFIREVPANEVVWVKSKNSFIMVCDDVFPDLAEKARLLGCEIYVYPKGNMTGLPKKVS